MSFYGTGNVGLLPYHYDIPGYVSPEWGGGGISGTGLQYGEYRPIYTAGPVGSPVYVDVTGDGRVPPEALTHGTGIQVGARLETPNINTEGARDVITGPSGPPMNGAAGGGANAEGNGTNLLIGLAVAAGLLAVVAKGR
jgi:hypothetical protein